MKGLSEKVAVVTGGANGIGRATALEFSKNNVSVVIADKDVKGGLSTFEEILSMGGKCIFVPTDISIEKDVKNMAEEAKKSFGRIDILVNNAANFVLKGIEASVEEWQEILAVNVIGTVICTNFCVKYMKQQGSGSVINICSISGLIAQKNFLTYNTSKSAIINMTRCMALDLATYNIRVNSVSPGMVWTKANGDYIKRTTGLDKAQADIHPDFGGKSLVKRMASPEEIAPTILFLASDWSSFITAENVVVDGGYTAV